MPFSLDRKCPRLIDFSYNHAELVSRYLWSVVVTLVLMAFVTIVPEESLALIRELEIGYKALICVLAVIGVALLLYLTAVAECQKEQKIERSCEIQFNGTRKLYDSHVQILREQVAKARQEAEMLRLKERAPLDRQVRLFNRLSFRERKRLLDDYTDSEKTHNYCTGEPTMLKLLQLGYIEKIDDYWYCLSDKTCDLFDARFEELMAKLTKDEIADPSDSYKQQPATSSEDMHPDAVIARKYAEGDPETIRNLNIFDP